MISVLEAVMQAVCFVFAVSVLSIIAVGIFAWVMQNDKDID